MPSPTNIDTDDSLKASNILDAILASELGDPCHPTTSPTTGAKGPASGSQAPPEFVSVTALGNREHIATTLQATGSVRTNLRPLIAIVCSTPHVETVSGPSVINS